MPSPLQIGPINAATPAPLLPDGRLDRSSVKKLAQRWRDVGLDGVFVLGSIGEGLVLSDDVRNEFVEASLEATDRRITIFAGTSDSSRQRMRERAIRYARMGAHCIVLCIPAGIAPAKGVADVLAVAEACPAPCAYYENPFNTITALVLDELLEILAHPNIVALKDSSNNALIAQALTSPKHRPRDVKLLYGIEYATTFAAGVGYDGVLHGGGVLTGRRVRQIWDLARRGEHLQALALERELSLCLAQIYNRFSRPLQNVAGQKHALKLLGAMDHDTAVEQHLSDADRARIAKAVEQNPWLRRHEL